MASLSPDLIAWLDASAINLDTGADEAASVLPKLADAGLFRIGVPVKLGGSGGDVGDAVAAIAAVAERSLTAGFVFWGHRTFIECLLQSANAALRETLLPDLLAGRRGGAVGLSNAMKFLSGIEGLLVHAQTREASLRIDGKLPWVTNLSLAGFDVAVAVQSDNDAPTFIAALSSDDSGLERSANIGLMAMRGSNTAAIKIDNVRIGQARIIHPDAGQWLPKMRPAFLSLQCAMSIGLARRALEEAASRLHQGRDILSEPVATQQAALAESETQLRTGLRSGRFIEQPASLFRLRIRLAEITAEAVQLELSASGGRAYLTPAGEGFQRRLREVAFIPIITPSLVQLKVALALHAQPQAISETA